MTESAIDLSGIHVIDEVIDNAKVKVLAESSVCESEISSTQLVENDMDFIPETQNVSIYVPETQDVVETDNAGDDSTEDIGASEMNSKQFIHVNIEENSDCTEVTSQYNENELSLNKVDNQKEHTKAKRKFFVFPFEYF